MTDAAEMPRYQSHRKIWALEIADVTGATLSFAEEGFAPIEVEPSMFVRYTPVPGDFYLTYEDGYKSICPGKQFRDGYSPVKDGPAEDIKTVAAKLRQMIADVGASRPLSVAHTKLEEAEMWLERHFTAS
jgi:hypothetical protein